MRGVGVGPLGPVRGQSVLRQAVGQAQQAPEAVQQLLKVRPPAHRPLQRFNCGHVRSALESGRSDKRRCEQLAHPDQAAQSSGPLMLTLNSIRTGSSRTVWKVRLAGKLSVVCGVPIKVVPMKRLSADPKST